ncbi:MAG: nitrous oxide reductase family maturation protein NosD [Rhodospirillales bacterium]|nr:nitrous oxide reductase family maturation protein NosD [Rhodospirillales bacterium]MCW9001956.1 nitrous oxide reductase family maturation protein NosD [Rhodospirillales bacterium]
MGRLQSRGWIIFAAGGVILLAAMIHFFVNGIAAAPAGPTSARVADLSLQEMLEQAEEGAVITLPPGVYAGPVVIDKPLTLDGGGKATIDAGGKGTVVLIDADGVTVKNLRLIGSGESHNDIDSGVQVRGKYNIVSDNVIEDCLFGVDLGQSNNNIVRRNTIHSKHFDLGVRGDAVRLWYSMHNKITDNVIDGSRDMVVWYSANNDIKNNTVRNGRYGLHFMYAKYNLVEGNRYENNSVGIFLMYSDDVVVRGNTVIRGLGTTGMGIGLKETSNVDLTDNQIYYTETGIYLDVSPFQPDMTNRVFRNTVAYSTIGIKFLNDWTGNIIHDNHLHNNIHQVTVQALASAKRNDWQGNYWDDYEGFDRNQDGIGDFPYDIWVFADRIWMDVPYARFYKGSPVLTALDFLERLAPLTQPILMLRDERPKMKPEFATVAKAGGKADEESAGSDQHYDPFGLRKP